MGLLSKAFDKLFLKQWSIGFANYNISEIIKQKKTNLNFNWISISDKNRFYADPFIFTTEKGEINVLFEDLTTQDKYGKLSLITLDHSLKPISQKLILDNKIHLSYPFTFQERGKTFVFPEAARSGALYCYEFNSELKSLIDKRKIIDLPIIDPTILKHNDVYWLFGTLLDEYYNSKLYIYYSDSLFGPYQAHEKNPVKNNLNGSRPAGDFIRIDEHVYRPAQNCKEYYGESITINKILVLNKGEFAEEEYMIIGPDKRSQFSFGLHTINVTGNVVVVDGLRRHFQPIQQLKKRFTKFRSGN